MISRKWENEESFVLSNHWGQVDMEPVQAKEKHTQAGFPTYLKVEPSDFDMQGIYLKRLLHIAVVDICIK